MAHNIHYNEQRGQHSFFSVKEKPWHGLGKVVDKCTSSKKAMEYAGLDFGVERRTIFTSQKSYIPGSERLIIGDHFATVRTDNEVVLGIVGKDYRVVQNTDAFSFFDSIVRGEGIRYETAGALGKGERIFITAKLPSYIRVGREDLIEQYLFLTTSHDGSGSVTAAFTPIRIVCNNTLNAALKNMSNSVRIRHTNNAKQKLQQAHHVMGITNTLSQQLETPFNHWSKVKITDKEMYRIIQLALLPNKEARQRINRGREEELSTHFLNNCNHAYEYAMSNETQQLETTRGMLFGAYNSVSGYLQNIHSYKDDEAKIKSLLFGGTGQQRTQKAFNLCASFEAKGNDAFLLN
ncbi:MAG: DUF945 domain-containing protein [Bacteroidota bacterium]|nr:DUF945 domain-containing protein [Bacteroidota bacterium]